MTIAPKITCTAILLLCASAAAADPIPPGLIEQLRPNVFREAYVAEVMKPLRSADRNVDGLDREDISIDEAVTAAQTRVMQLNVLRNDLDGDLKITPKEIALSWNKKGIVPYDADGDGTVTFEEIVGYKPAVDLTPHKARHLLTLLELDPDKDGRLTPDELESLARSTFTEADKDGNGQLSAEEIVPHKPKQQMAGRPSSCQLPKPEADQHVVVYGLYEGGAISDAGLTRANSKTTYSRIDIEDGEKPLYVAVSAHAATILEFQGDVKRIAKLVLLESGKARPLAAMGVDKDRIAWGVNCELLAFHSSDGPKNEIARGVAQQALGRAPDGMVGIYAPAAVSLPSGFVQPKASAPKSAEKPTFGSVNTPDVVKVDPAKVVSQGGATKLDVLPGRAGLAQLVNAGVLEELDFRTFKILKEMTFPADLQGAHAVRFILGKGAPQPKGDPGHSCVTNEETGEAKGAICPR